MEQAILAVGLPVTCIDCGAKGSVKPRSDYGGWYKSRLLRNRAKKWYCPSHAVKYKKVEDRFLSGGYSKNTPIEVETKEKSVEEQLYDLID